MMELHQSLYPRGWGLGGGGGGVVNGKLLSVGLLSDGYLFSGCPSPLPASISHACLCS